VKKDKEELELLAERTDFYVKALSIALFVVTLALGALLGKVDQTDVMRVMIAIIAIISALLSFIWVINSIIDLSKQKDEYLAELELLKRKDPTK
jgi:hypothetical protein